MGSQTKKRMALEMEAGARQRFMKDYVSLNPKPPKP